MCIINEEAPHFIAGTESWLNSSAFSNEVFPNNYHVFRKDRLDGYGGVFFAFLNNFYCSQIDVSTPCEAIACKIDLSKNGRLIVLTVYRPPNSDRENMHNLCQFIKEIHNKYIDDVIWITADFNLPNINWDLNSVTSNAYPLDICNMLIDVFSIGGFFQLVTTPTRSQNILDLFATNRPTLVERLSITSGLSDYKIINVESSLSSVVVQPKPRKVYLWNRANFQNINEIMSDFSNSCHNIDTPIEELWNIFKTQCKTCLNSIPTKSLSSSIKHPKITTSIRRLSKCRLSPKSTVSSLFRDLRNGT